MKYTLEQRHAIYKKALEIYGTTITESGFKYYGLCHYIERAGKLVLNQYVDIFDLPDFLAKEPNNYSSRKFNLMWFNDSKYGDKQRIAILKKLIEETAPTNTSVNKC